MFAILLSAALPTWTLVCGGDLMLNGISPKSNPFAKEVRAAFASADVAYANLEIPLTNQGKPTPFKSAKEVKARTQFILRADPRHMPNVASCGFDLLSLGNNHAMDYGFEAAKEGQSALRKLGIESCGIGTNSLDARTPAVFRAANGVRVALISYLAFVTEGAMAKCGAAKPEKPGVNALIGPNPKRLSAEIAAARKRADVVLVALHWGIERTKNPTPFQINLAHSWIDAGADAVLGAHPHVLQGTQIYKGKPILYSLGNLISPLPAQTALYRLTFAGTKFQGMEILPATIAGGKVSLETKNVAVRRKAIAELDQLVGKKVVMPAPKKKPTPAKPRAR